MIGCIVLSRWAIFSALFFRLVFVSIFVNLLNTFLLQKVIKNVSKPWSKNKHSLRSVLGMFWVIFETSDVVKPCKPFGAFIENHICACSTSSLHNWSKSVPKGTKINAKILQKHGPKSIQKHTSFLPLFGSILAPFWPHFGSILAPKCHFFGYYVPDRPREPPRSAPGSPRSIILETFGAHLMTPGSLFGAFSDHKAMKIQTLVALATHTPPCTKTL